MTSPTDFPNLLAFWNFQEAAGEARVAAGLSGYRLQERDGLVPCENDGVFGPHSARFGEGPWLCLPRNQTRTLNIHGPHAQVTVVAWIKRSRTTYDNCQAVAGLWNEHGLRQYCLFLNLRIHESLEQVGAHISSIGTATPGFKYCMDAAIGATPVPFGIWQCVAISYDGRQAYAWLNGELDVRGDRNPYAYPGGIFDGGAEGADFTVGAVQRPEWVDEDRQPHGAITANPFHGLLGGLAIYDRALTADEIRALAKCGSLHPS
jgi:hypothetical protein